MLGQHCRLVQIVHCSLKCHALLPFELLLLQLQPCFYKEPPQQPVGCKGARMEAFCSPLSTQLYVRIAQVGEASRLQAACSRCGTSTAPSVLEAPTRIGHRRARAADTSLQTNHARASPRGAPLTTVSWLWHGARAADTSLQPNHAPHRAVGRRRLQPLAGCAAARRRRACWTPTMLPRELEF